MFRLVLLHSEANMPELAAAIGRMGRRVLTETETEKVLAEFRRGVGRAATYVLIAHGAGLLSVATILPNLLKDPKLAVVALPAWFYLGWGFVVAMFAYYFVLVAPTFKHRHPMDQVFVGLAIVGLAGSVILLGLTLRELYDALKAASVIPG